MNTIAPARKAKTKTNLTPHTARTRAAHTATPEKTATSTVSASSRSASKGRRAKASTPIAPPTPPTPVEPTYHSKQARMIAVLRAVPGATIEQMMTLTGWQAHTVRGTISGVLRKKLGLNVTCEVGDIGTRVYRIVGTKACA